MMLSVFLLAGEQVERALHLSLAALLGSDIYNFGELVGHLCLTFCYLSFLCITCTMLSGSLIMFCVNTVHVHLYCMAHHGRIQEFSVSGLQMATCT